MYSKQTEKIGLPIWTPPDHPDWLTDMNEENQILDREVGKHNEDISNLEETIGAIAEDFVTIQEGFDEIKRLVDENLPIENNSAFQTLVSDMDTAKRDIVNIQMNLQTNNQSIERLQSDVATLQGDMTTVLEDISHLKSDVSDLQQHYNQLKDITDQLNVLVQNINAQLDDIYSKLIMYKNIIDDNVDKIRGLSTRLDEVDNQLEEIDSQVVKNSTDIGNLQSNITEVSNNIAGNTTKINELTDSVSTASQKADQALNTANETRNDLASVNGSVQTNGNKIAELEGSLGDLTTRVSTNETNTNNNTTEISALDTRVENLENQIGIIHLPNVKVVEFIRVVANPSITLNAIVYFANGMICATFGFSSGSSNNITDRTITLDLSTAQQINKNNWDDSINFQLSTITAIPAGPSGSFATQSWGCRLVRKNNELPGNILTNTMLVIENLGTNLHAPMTNYAPLTGFCAYGISDITRDIKDVYGENYRMED